MNKSTIFSAAFAVASLSFTGVASAVTEVDASSTVQTNFDANILTNDLIENGSAALSGVSTTGNVSTYGGDVPPNNNFDHLTDGAASSKITNNDLSHDTYFDGGSLATNPSITYNFNTGANPLGFTLTSLNSIEGWADSRSFSDQRFTVSTSLVAAPTTFTVLQDVTYTPFPDNNQTPNSSQVTLNFSPADLQSVGVAAVKIAFLPNLGINGGQQVFREIDVTGAATVPEPSTVAALIGGAGMLLGLRRRSP